MNLKSPRLQFAYEQLILGQDVWDICCDHGYLGGAAYKSKKFNHIYFVDPVQSIMEKLEDRFKKFVKIQDSNSQAFFLQLSGQNINQPLLGNICILGVGGELIFEILKTLNDKNLLCAERLILCPHKDEKWLLENIILDFNKTYLLTHQQTIQENHRNRIFYILDKVISL